MAKKDFSRSSRVSQEVQKLLNGYMQRDMEDEELRLVSLNEVKVANDLSHAKVYWRSINKDFDQKELQTKLQDVAKKLRYLLSQEMQIRKVPELHFVFDSSIDHAAHIDTLLAKTRELSKNVQKDVNLDDSEE